MAIFTSWNGKFEITALSFSPQVITIGEETAYSITVKNISGAKISSLSLRMNLYYPDITGGLSHAVTAAAYGTAMSRADISWAAGAEYTFAGTYTFTPTGGDGAPDITTRLVPLYTGGDAGYTNAPDARLGMMLNFVTDSYTDAFYDVRGENSEYLAVIDARYHPGISSFGGERYDGAEPGDEGEAFGAQVLLQGSSAMVQDRMSLHLYWERTSTVTQDSAYVDLGGYIPEALAAVMPVDILVPGPFDKAFDWNLVLWFGDAYESARAGIVLSRAFANLHLSGRRTGGACFGGFCASGDGNPMLESYYKFHPYGGIAGVTDYASEETPTHGTWIDGKPIYRYVFTTSVSSSGTITIGKLPSTPEAIVNYFGVMKQASGSFNFLPNVYFGSSSWTVGCYVNENDEIILQCASGYSGTRSIVLVFDYTRVQDEAPVYYSISRSLTNVTADDLRVQILSGAAYTVQLTAEEGCVLGGVTVTMGGVDVTDTVYGNGVISIGAVTGDIVITAAAVEEAEPDPEPTAYTNQIPISTDADGAIYNGTGWKAGYRISSSFVEGTCTGMCISGYIFVPAGAVVRIKNVTMPGTNTSYIVEYDAGRANPVVHLVEEYFDSPDENGVYASVINSSLDRYIRLSFGMINNSSIVTVDEEIPAGTEAGRVVDAASVGYTADSRWSTSEGSIRSGATGIAAIHTVSFERAAGSTVWVKLAGLNWTYNNNCTLAAFADDAFVFGGYLNAEKTDTVIGYNILHGENGEVTLEFYDPGNSAAYAAVNGFRVSGLGEGPDAVITVYGEAAV